MIKPAELFKVLATDTRCKIIEILKKDGPHCVCILAKRLGITNAALSQHLRILKGVHLVESDKKGYWVHYSLNKSMLRKYQKLLSSIYFNK